MSLTRVRFAIPRSVLLALLTILTTAGLLASPVATPRADAAVSASTELRALHVAASKKGAPYHYGSAGPRAFDCSGFTMYVYARVGKRLPRTSAAQYRATIHISARQARPGDLVFFHYGRSIYHVAIYAGHGRIWHAPKTGKRVSLVRLWTNQVYYGRVR